MAKAKKWRGILSRQEAKRKIASGHSTGNKKQGAGYYVVGCVTHGKKRSPKDVDFWVRVSQPKNKRHQFYTGCPSCLKEGSEK